MTNALRLALVCVGGGRGARFGGDKLAETVGGRSVFCRSLASLVAACPAASVVAVCPADQLDEWQLRLRDEFPGIDCVAGGERRQDSVRLGVAAAEARGAEVVAIHDAARPLVHPEDVRRCVESIGGYDGVILCRAVTDTVKRVAADGRVVGTVARDELRLALTPQVFRLAALARAWAAAADDELVTDEAALLEAAGLTVGTVEARHPNPKITTRADLAVIRALAEDDRGEPAWPAVGTGGRRAPSSPGGKD